MRIKLSFCRAKLSYQVVMTTDKELLALFHDIFIWKQPCDVIIQ